MWQRDQAPDKALEVSVATKVWPVRLKKPNLWFGLEGKPNLCCNTAERREKLGGGAAAGVGFARLHRREGGETAHVAAAAAAAAVSITLRRDVVSPAHFRVPGKSL